MIPISIPVNQDCEEAVLPLASMGPSSQDVAAILGQRHAGLLPRHAVAYHHAVCKGQAVADRVGTRDAIQYICPAQVA